RERAAGLGQEAHRGIGEGRVPARERDIVVLLIARVPAEHDVAEAEALLEGGEELGAVDELAAQDAVVVEHANLDVCESPLLDDGAGLTRAADFFWLHELSLLTAALIDRSLEPPGIDLDAPAGLGGDCDLPVLDTVGIREEQPCLPGVVVGALDRELQVLAPV